MTFSTYILTEATSGRVTYTTNVQVPLPSATTVPKTPIAGAESQTSMSNPSTPRASTSAASKSHVGPVVAGTVIPVLFLLLLAACFWTFCKTKLRYAWRRFPNRAKGDVNVQPFIDSDEEKMPWSPDSYGVSPAHLPYGVFRAGAGHADMMELPERAATPREVPLINRGGVGERASRDGPRSQSYLCQTYEPEPGMSQQYARPRTPREKTPRHVVNRKYVPYSGSSLAPAAPAPAITPPAHSDVHSSEGTASVRDDGSPTGRSCTGRSSRSGTDGFQSIFSATEP